MVNGVEYGVHVVWSIRYSVRLTPDPLPSVARRANGVPAGKGGAEGSIDVVGGVSSRTTGRVCSGSAFPRRSVDRYATVCAPSPVRVNGPEYAVHAPLSMRTSVVSSPTGVAPPSVAARVSGVDDVTNMPPTECLGSPTERT